MAAARDTGRTMGGSHASTQEPDGVRAARAVLADVAPLLEDLSLPRDLSPSTIARAGLLRCRDLLADMLVLYERGAPVGIGALARILFETWVRVWHVVLGGSEALQLELGEHYRQLRRWSPTAHAEVQERYDAAPRKPISFRDTVARVRTLLDDADFGDPDVVVEGYEFLYRVESAASVHGGLTGVLLWLVERGDDRLAPRPAFDRQVAAARLRTCAAMVGWLADYIDERWLDPDRDERRP